MKKGAVTTEFAFAIGVGMLFLIIMQGMYFQKNAIIAKTQDEIEVEKKAVEIASQIQIISENPGMTTSFNSPKQLLSGNIIAIQISNSSVYIISDLANASKALYVSNISNESGSQSFTLKQLSDYNVTSVDYGSVILYAK